MGRTANLQDCGMDCRVLHPVWDKLVLSSNPTSSPGQSKDSHVKLVINQIDKGLRPKMAGPGYGVGFVQQASFVYSLCSARVQV